jgi:hypothetical protein
MEDEKQNLEESLRRSIRNDIIRRNQLRGPLSYDAEKIIDLCTEIEMENTHYERKYNPLYQAGRDDE